MNKLRDYLNELIKAGENLIRKAGILSSWLNIILVLIIAVDVLFRYFLDHTSVWVTELEWHLFSIVFLLGAAYTMQADGHVRVDVFLQRGTEKQKKLVTLIGHLLLLIPMCLFLIPPAWDYFYQSWSISEGSGDPGGIPALYPIKAFIPISFVLVLSQAIIESLRIFMDLTSTTRRTQHD